MRDGQTVLTRSGRTLRGACGAPASAVTRSTAWIRKACTAVGLMRAPKVTERFEQSIGTLTNRSLQVERPEATSVSPEATHSGIYESTRARELNASTRPDNSCVMYLPCLWSLRSLPHQVHVEARCTMRRFLLYVHRQVPRKSAPCLAHSWVRQLGVFGCRVVSPGSAIGIGSVK